MASKPPPPSSKPAQGGDKPSDGCFQSMDQMSNWVRYADTKATILIAGFGVILTLLVGNSETVTLAITQGGAGSAMVGGLAIAAGSAALVTLFWLGVAIKPQRSIAYSTINRFAFPSLLTTDVNALLAHADIGNIREEAWQQVLDLAKIADKKFSACNRAVTAFALLVCLGVACVVTAHALTA
jgi:hypothetical protein